MAATLVACGYANTRRIRSGFSIGLLYRGYWLTRWRGTGIVTGIGFLGAGDHHIEIVSVATERSKLGHLMVLEVRLPTLSIQHAMLTDLGALLGVEVRTVNRAEEA